MTTVTLTEFRGHASGMLTRVENGETLVVLRHGRPIAEISPVARQSETQPSWKRPALRLSTKGAVLSSAILDARGRNGIDAIADIQRESVQKGTDQLSMADIDREKAAARQE